MGIMDLSINQEAMGVQNRFGNQVFKLNKFDETDVQGNNNFYNSRKTDTNNDSGSLFRDGYPSENLQVDPSLFSYSSFKKAMDLRTHNRIDDENRRTIFDDAEYFAKNFFYKLLPITFEQVDETIIHTEHNYSLFSLNSESETEEDCSRTMDYSQIKEKNYKRRRTKFKEGSDEEMWDENEGAVDSNQNIPNQKEPSVSEPESVSDNSVQPLDLSTALPVQELKTDNYHRHLKEQEEHSDVRDESPPSKLKCIQVTITRPDEKENYQPCDMFLNDIARLVPRLINNDCFEIDILDRTGDPNDDLRKHRLYYIIAESTWQLFQSTRERVILTNDHTLGPPVKKIEKDERPTFLVFDQFSLAKCLAEYCEEIGGCFEYTCVEEEAKSEKEEDVKNTKMIELVKRTIEMDKKDERVTEINAEETNTEKTQKDELSIKTKEGITEGVNPKIKSHEIEDTRTSSGSGENLEIKLMKAANGDNFIKTKPEKLGEQDIKTEEKNDEQTERVDLQSNVIKTNAEEGRDITTHTQEMPLNSNPIEKKTKKKRRKESEVNVKNMNWYEICAEELKGVKVEAEETEPVLNNEETFVIAVDPEFPKTDDLDTKEAKEMKAKANVEDTKITVTEKAKSNEMSFKNKKAIEENLKTTKTEGAEIIDGGRKSDEENILEATEVLSRKRRIEMKEIKVIKKCKKFKKTVQTFAKKTEASVTDVKETKVNSNAKEKPVEIKKAFTKEIKRTDRYKKGSEEPEGDRKRIKALKRGRKSIERGKVSDKSEEKSKISRMKVEKTKNPPSRKKVQSESNLLQAVPHIKTRSQSTSEPETSQKPNTQTRKPRKTKKELVEGMRIKGTLEKRTRSGKVLEEGNQDLKVKGNGRGVRGIKKNMEEGQRVALKKCLRSQRRKRK